ncbi:MAG: Ultraviolet N-glycosylase/AP lyase [Candidatus Heimdallarchaeota archaeon LC_3]|nr:MAG: Ultraviolet N-glycosylase/AP lyase [Candidatus Heimdallarchaeota archaeon LC_3]
MNKNIKTIIRTLKDTYPDSQCSLDYNNPWNLLVATILSAQSTDATVNKVTPFYFKQYPAIEDTVKANITDIEDIIRPCGLYTRKAKSIRDCAIKIHKDYANKVPNDMKQLVKLPGVGRKTANVILGVAYNIALGIVVDTHVKRISKLLAWTKLENPDRIEKDLMNIIQKQDWIIIGHLLIDHGRNICNAKKPLCKKCSIELYCPSSKIKN